MQVDIFKLEFWKFIFYNLWTFIGFIIIILVIRGDIQKFFKKTFSNISSFKENLKNVLTQQRRIDRIKQEHLREIERLTNKNK